MKRWLALLALLTPNLSGCLYYAYPTVAHVPEQMVPNPDGSVQAFRVDVDHTLRQPLPTVTQYTLARIPVPLGQRGVVPSQLEIGANSGVYNPLGVVDTTDHERSEYTMQVRLYRPGYRTMTVKAWDKSRELNWVAAPDLAAQESALDDLLAMPTAPGQVTKSNWWDSRDDRAGRGLQAGGVSATHADVLRFASSEYQRLANSPLAAAATLQPTRDRLRSKAVWLRSFADRLPES